MKKKRKTNEKNEVQVLAWIPETTFLAAVEYADKYNANDEREARMSLGSLINAALCEYVTNHPHGMISELENENNK